MDNKNNNQADIEAIEKIIKGDIDAYATIMKRYEAKLHRYVSYLIHDPAKTQDAVQETFIKAYQNLQGFNPKYKFSSWIYRIAHNEAMNAIKKTPQIINKDISELSDVGYSDDTGDLIDKAILKENIHACLQHLTPKYKEVIQLIYFENMQYEEVSDILRIPVSTVGVWLMRAKAQLKGICEKRGVKP